MQSGTQTKIKTSQTSALHDENQKPWKPAKMTMHYQFKGHFRWDANGARQPSSVHVSHLFTLTVACVSARLPLFRHYQLSPSTVSITRDWIDKICCEIFLSVAGFENSLAGVRCWVWCCQEISGRTPAAASNCCQSSPNISIINLFLHGFLFCMIFAHYRYKNLYIHAFWLTSSFPLPQVLDQETMAGAWLYFRLLMFFQRSENILILEILVFQWHLLPLQLNFLLFLQFFLLFSL